MYEREGFRGYLDRLLSRNHLLDLHEPLDSRHIATLVDQSDKALLFHRVIGYDMPVVSGLIRSSERMAIGMGVERYADIEHVLTRASLLLLLVAVTVVAWNGTLSDFLPYPCLSVLICGQNKFSPQGGKKIEDPPERNSRRLTHEP